MLFCPITVLNFSWARHPKLSGWMYVWMYVCPTFLAKVFMDFSPYCMGYFLALWCRFQAKKIDLPHPLCPSPFLGVFWGDFSRNFVPQFWPIWDFLVWIFMFLASEGLTLGFFFVWPNFDFWALGRWSKWVSPGLGVVLEVFLQTWSCYILLESIFDADFEFRILIFGPSGRVSKWGSPGGHPKWISPNMAMLYIDADFEFRICLAQF